MTWRNWKLRLPHDVAVALAALALFMWLARAMMHGDAVAFDATVRNGVHAAASPALTYAMRGISELGETVFLATLGGLLVWRLVSAGRRREAVFFVVAALGAGVIDQVLKFWFQRPRPEAFFVPEPLNYSFPSGHAFVCSCFYLVMAEILIQVQWPRARKLALWTLALVLIGLIGLSRVYLGVHYPTDVLGGYAAAIAWLATVRAGQKMRRVEGRDIGTENQI